MHSIPQLSVQCIHPLIPRQRPSRCATSIWTRQYFFNSLIFVSSNLHLHLRSSPIALVWGWDEGESRTPISWLGDGLTFTWAHQPALILLIPQWGYKSRLSPQPLQLSSYFPTSTNKCLASPLINLFVPCLAHPESLYRTQQQVVCSDSPPNRSHANSLLDRVPCLHDADQVDLRVGCHRECTSSSSAIASMMSLSLTSPTASPWRL
jgi:hypothetical protein